MTVKEFYEQCFEDYQQENKAENTWRSRGSMMRLHFVPVIGNKELVDVNHEDINEIYALMSAKGLKQNTIFGMQSALGGFFNLAIERGFITSSPMIYAEKIKPDDGTSL